MKLIEGQLYLEFSDAISAGINQDTILKAKLRNSPSWQFINDPKDQRKILINYECLRDTYKEKIITRFGNPYEFFAKEPIRKMVTKDLAAEKFFFDYKYDGTKNLPIDTQRAYTTAANWLNMLIKADADKKEIKRLLNLTITDFWVKVCEIIESDSINLPSNIKKLQSKIKLYKEQGYSCLIHKNYGNGHARKIDDELSEAILLEIIAKPYIDDVVACRAYNAQAAKLNKPQISISTVGNWRRNNLHLISTQKFGVKETYNTFGKYIKRKRSSCPLIVVEHDDNVLDLYFRDKDKSKFYQRYVMAIVMDPFNDYILGWAYAESNTKELIKFAYLDAMHHIKDLTGSYYLPHQIRSDRFGLDPKLNGDLAEFYKSLAIYTPAAAKAPRGKYIERAFGDKWRQVLSCYPNYAGNNVGSKELIGKINEDHRDAVKRQYPTVDQAPAQMSEFINVLRHLINDETGLSKQEEWLNAFNENEKSKAHPISDAMMLLKLGMAHDYKNTITNRGITPSINGKERTYEIPEEYYLQTVGKKVQIIYDPMDFSRVLVTDNKNLMFVASEQEAMPSAIADYQPGDGIKLHDRIAEKKRHNELVFNRMVDRQNVLQINRINSESLLQAGIHSKQIMHEAIASYQVESEPEMQQKRINQKGRSLEDMINQM